MFVFREVLVLLLWSMLNDKQPFEMRCAVLYCFECYLYRNDFGKMKIVQQLLPLEKEGTYCLPNTVMLSHYLNCVNFYFFLYSD